MEAFFDPSPQALSSQGGQFTRKYDFPFDLVPLGKSFPVGAREVKNIAVLRAMATRYGKRLKRQFRVIDHGEQGFEVFYRAEIPDDTIAVIVGKPAETPTIADDGDIPGRYRG